MNPYQQVPATTVLIPHASPDALRAAAAQTGVLQDAPDNQQKDLTSGPAPARPASRRAKNRLRDAVEESARREEEVVMQCTVLYAFA